MKIVVYNLGCKVNQYECDSIVKALKEKGHQVSENLEFADTYILNTCAVTNEAERKSRQCIERCLKFNDNAKIFRKPPMGKPGERFHPTQKPVELYAWILDLYAKPGMRILDTHAGSASSLVACHRAGLDAWGFEIDETYYKLASERLARERAQVNIMDLMKGEDNFDQLEIAFAK